MGYDLKCKEIMGNRDFAVGRLVVCAWVVALLALPVTSQAMTCEEVLAVGSCVRRFYAIGYHRLTGTVTTFSQYPTGNWDDTCASFSLARAAVTVPAGTDWTLSVAKYYWDPSSKTWKNYIGALNVMQIMTRAHLDIWTSGAVKLDEQYERAARYMGEIDLNALYPNGCSDLPSQQPDQTPNPDTGKPECNNQGL